MPLVSSSTRDDCQQNRRWSHRVLRFTDWEGWPIGRTQARISGPQIVSLTPAAILFAVPVRTHIAMAMGLLAKAARALGGLTFLEGWKGTIRAILYLPANRILSCPDNNVELVGTGTYAGDRPAGIGRRRRPPATLSCRAARSTNGDNTSAQRVAVERRGQQHNGRHARPD